MKGRVFTRLHISSVANPDPGSGMNIPDHDSGSLVTIFGVKNTFADQDSESGAFYTLDPGTGINIPDPPHCTMCGADVQVCSAHLR